VREINASLLTMVSSSKQKLNRKTMKLTDIMNQIDITDIYRTFHPNTKEYAIFSAFYEMVTKSDHILSHKASLNRDTKIEITACT
jgi:exonuclease III